MRGKVGVGVRGGRPAALKKFHEDATSEGPPETASSGPRLFAPGVARAGHEALGVSFYPISCLCGFASRFAPVLVDLGARAALCFPKGWGWRNKAAALRFRP